MQDLTDIAPHGHHDVDIVMPNNGVYEHYDVIQRDPYSVAPYRNTEPANLGYQREQSQNGTQETAYGCYWVRCESVHFLVECLRVWFGMPASDGVIYVDCEDMLCRGS